MNYRAPVDSPVSLYFKTFPLKIWSHRHFFKHTGTLDLDQATRLWFDNIITIKYLPGSLVDEELFTTIIRRKMANVFDANEKKRKYAEDEVHTNSVMTSAELLKDTFEHHRKNTKRKLDAPATPSNVTPIVTSVVNISNETLILGLKAKSDDDEPDMRNIEFDQYLYDKPDTKNIEFDQYLDDENFIQEKLLLNNSYILETNVVDTPIATDEDLGLEKAEKAVRESFTRTFPSPTDQKMFDTMQFIFLQL
ncbi:11546_t:CDS:2 [Acaulospora colombiana]|uniref:11546_t:CDS:1 n=1 Tax=Acaulospora colombiana TaxID=27376 RepID=A0ACA9JVW2_9GLOM|nr:11546_t:CDS:2 [Acaulospora colombiana]